MAEASNFVILGSALRRCAPCSARG